MRAAPLSETSASNGHKEPSTAPRSVPSRCKEFNIHQSPIISTVSNPPVARSQIYTSLPSYLLNDQLQ